MTRQGSSGSRRRPRPQSQDRLAAAIKALAKLTPQELSRVSNVLVQRIKIAAKCELNEARDLQREALESARQSCNLPRLNAQEQSALTGLESAQSELLLPQYVLSNLFRLLRDNLQKL